MTRLSIRRSDAAMRLVSKQPAPMRTGADVGAAMSA